MPFIDIARAIYAYTAASDDELTIEEHDLLYVLEKGDDDWWKVKKKVEGDDDGPITPISSTRTLYDYTAQTEEELSFPADITVDIFDKEDQDWFLVRLKQSQTSEWEYGFVPSNYLDDGDVESAAKLPSVLPTERPDSLDERRPLTPPYQEEPEEIELMEMSTYGRPQEHYTVRNTDAKFKTWDVEEIDSRKRRKRGTLGIGNSSIVWSCESSKEPVQTWPITSLIEYNTEKKHLFIELSSPPTPASFHFHAESRSMAAEIAAAIGEIAGATRATGLREVAAASGDPLPPLPETSALAQRHKREDSDEVLPIDDGVKRGVMLYDFDAQGDDELGVRQDQIVEILDDSHEEWWKCKSGSRQGVVPASYVEVIKTRPAPQKDREQRPSTDTSARDHRRSSPPPSQTHHSSLSKPDPTKIRTWTDRSGSFKVEAQFLGLRNSKIQLHKLNGVKISVPLTKMSLDDVAYVNRLTGPSSPPPPKPPPDSEKPRRRIEFDWFQFFLECGVDYNVCQRYALSFEKDQMDEGVLPDINSDTLRTLGVREGDILRVMKRLDEKFGRAGAVTAGRKKSVRFGGVEEEDEAEKDDLADVVKVHTPVEKKESIFSSGPSGALRNNTTRRGRPTTTKAVSDEVDPTLLSTSADVQEPDREKGEKHGVRPLRVPPSRLANMPDTDKANNSGFEDDAWTVKAQKKQPAAQVQQQPPAVQIQSPQPLQSGPPPGSAMHDLSGINAQNNQSLPPPLQPQAASQPAAQLSPQPTASMAPRPASVPPAQSTPQAQPLQAQLTGLPPQSQYHPPMPGPTPAQAAGTQSLDQQLANLQIYKQQQMLQVQPTGYIPAMQPQPTGYMNGFTSPPPQMPTLTGVPLQPQPTGFMPNFLPPGQQNSVLGPTRSFSASLAPPLIPTNTSNTPQFITAHRTGPANFGSGPTPQFQSQPPPPPPVQLPPQPTGFQPITMQPQMTGYQPQPQQMLAPQQTGLPSFLPPSQTNALAPQVTGFQQQMMPHKTGMAEFKPVSFGTRPKPLVPTRTGRARANLAAASTIHSV